MALIPITIGERGMDDIANQFQDSETGEMIVCVCSGVSDRQLREAVRSGKTLDDVMRTTGAGTCCGTCVPAMARIVAAARAEGVALAMKTPETKREAA